MKKAKMMLIALGVFAVVGGALAFKAKTFNGTTYCTTNVSGDFCSVPSAIKPGTPGTQYFYKTTTTETCPSRFVCESASTTFIAD